MNNRRTILFPVVFLFFFASVSQLQAYPPDQPVFIKEILGQLEYVGGKVLQLENAMPQDKFTWRPADGIRSVSEVYMHIAGSNYLLINLVNGKEMPEDYMAEEKTTTDKGEIAEIVETSFDTLKEFVALLSEDDLNKTVNAFGMEFSVRNFLVTMLSHIHEHLGQSIAYARMNNVTPPWSMGESEG